MGRKNKSPRTHERLDRLCECTTAFRARKGFCFSTAHEVLPRRRLCPSHFFPWGTSDTFHCLGLCSGRSQVYSTASAPDGQQEDRQTPLATVLPGTVRTGAAVHSVVRVSCLRLMVFTSAWLVATSAACSLPHDAPNSQVPLAPQESSTKRGLSPSLPRQPGGVSAVQS